MADAAVRPALKVHRVKGLVRRQAEKREQSAGHREQGRGTGGAAAGGKAGAELPHSKTMAKE